MTSNATQLHTILDCLDLKSRPKKSNSPPKNLNLFLKFVTNHFSKVTIGDQNFYLKKLIFRYSSKF